VFDIFGIPYVDKGKDNEKRKGKDNLSPDNQK